MSVNELKVNVSIVSIVSIVEGQRFNRMRDDIEIFFIKFNFQACWAAG